MTENAVPASLTTVSTPAQPKTDAAPPRVEVLREAATLITGDRQQDYGPPSENFERIAGYWNVRFKDKLREGESFSPADVAMAMVLLKLAREVASPKRDTYVDAAGYVGLAFELRTNE